MEPVPSKSENQCPAYAGVRPAHPRVAGAAPTGNVRMRAGRAADSGAEGRRLFCVLALKRAAARGRAGRRAPSPLGRIRLNAPRFPGVQAAGEA